MQIRPVIQEVAEDLDKTMSMREAQELLCKSGWFNYLPSEKEVLTLIEGWKKTNYGNN